MAFTLPNFNLTLAIWREPRIPDDGPADIEDEACALYLYNRLDRDVVAGTYPSYTPQIILRARTTWHPQVGDIYQVAGNGITYYAHRWGHLIHQGFPNEYWSVSVEMVDSAGDVFYFQQQIDLPP